jgi:hypothetical protein
MFHTKFVNEFIHVSLQFYHTICIHFKGHVRIRNLELNGTFSPQKFTRLPVYLSYLNFGIMMERYPLAYYAFQISHNLELNGTISPQKFT